MLDINKVKKGDLVVVTDGPFAGQLGYFYSTYPYPEPTASQCLVKLIANNPKGEKQLLYIGDVMAVVAPKDEKTYVQTGPNTDIPEWTTYKLKQRVIIAKEGQYRGQAGIVRGINLRAGGCLVDYEVEPCNQPGSGPSICMVVREEDLVPSDYTRMSINGIDVGRYLDRNTLEVIARDVYEDALKDHVQEVIKARTFGSTTLVDWILGECARQYCEELAPHYKDAVLEKLKQEIDTVIPKEADPNGESFYTMFTQSLGQCADLYVRTHSQEIHELMKDNIVKAARNVSAESLASIIRRNIKVDDIIKQAFAEKPQE